MTPSRHPATALDAETLLQHSAWLARFARALVANESELDDVVQQTYAQALAQPPRHARNLRGWLGAIARNVVRTRARSDSARVAREVAMPPPPPVETPDQAVERAELRRSVVEAVLALNEPYRSTVVLRFFEEQEVAAIARLTRTGEDTVRTRLRRGVARVRELLERRVVDEKPGAADEGAAARALLYVHLREIAASAGSPAGAGGGGAPGSAAAPRGLVHEGGRQVASATSRRILVGAAAVVVAAGGWWAWKESGASGTRTPTMAANREPVPTAPPDSGTPPPEVAAERSSDATGTPPPPVISRPARRTQCGVIRGVITAPDGTPVAGARVWALLSLAHEAEYEMPDFGMKARLQAGVDPTKLLGAGWIATRSGEDGHYEFHGLSTVAGWSIGAYEPTLGAMVSDVHEFDHEHRELAVDVRLTPGSILRGSVHDEDGAPVGGARLFLFTTCGTSKAEMYGVANPVGPHIGDFDADFLCGDSIEVGCGTPGFLPTRRTKVDLTPHAKETVIPITVKRKPGILVRGRIVDPTGDRVDFGPLLKARFASDEPELRWERAAVWAITKDAKVPDLLLAGMEVPRGIIEGRIDFAESRYELVVSDGFQGSIELRIFKTLVGTAQLDDPHDPPAVECDEERLPKESMLTTFAVRYVDAETKEPIDLSKEDILPHANDAEAYAPIMLAESDPKHGLIQYHCGPGFLKLEPSIHGYVFNLTFLDVPPEPRPTPTIVEIPPAKAGVHGFARHADGRPFAKAEISAYRRTPDGWIDTTGPLTRTNPDGEFEFDALAKGEHVVVLSGQPEEAPAVARFVASDPFPEVEIHASVGRAIRFRILAKSVDGETPPDPQFRILDRDGLTLENLHTHWASVSKSPDEVTLRLEDGHYIVLVSRPWFRETRLEFDVPRETLEVPLEPIDSKSK